MTILKPKLFEKCPVGAHNQIKQNWFWLIAIAHFEKEREPGSRVTVQVIVGRFEGMLTIIITFSVPPNNPRIPWAVTLDPGSKWAIKHNLQLVLTKFLSLSLKTGK